MGTNTAIKTAVVAITAKNTLRVPTTAAALGPVPSARWRCTLSSTTMASSTISPAASTKCQQRQMLIEKPSIQLAASVPSREMGMAIAGNQRQTHRTRKQPDGANHYQNRNEQRRDDFPD
jgi:hypothetical protein